jgi:sulfofructose kinase
VLCVGAAVLDTLFRVTEMPTGQGKVLPYDMVQIAEGMASSAAYAVARLGGKASLWGAVGNDQTGAQITSELAEAGIDTSGMTVVDGARSALSTILIDDAGERLIVPFYDPRLHHTPKPVSETDVTKFDVVLVDVRWPELALSTLVAARQAGKPAIFDGDVAPVEILEKLGPAASHIIFSQPAAERMSAHRQPGDLVKAMKRKFPNAFICITFGEKGCYWLDPTNGDIRHVPALKIRSIDTLAAGDIFHGTFALAIAEGKEPEIALEMSSIAAAMKCEVFGGRTGAPERHLVIERARSAQSSLRTS